MYIIDENIHFKQHIIKPIKGSELYTSGDNNPFEAWIDKYARLFIQNALGNVLFSDFDGYMINGVLTGAPLKWTNLQNGVTYSYNNKSYTWKGLIFTEGLNNQSLIADYVFAEWYKYQLSSLTGFGESVGKSVNSKSGGAGAKEYKIWNKFARSNEGECEGGYVSLVDFLTHNEADYPDAQKKLYGLKNFASI